MKKRINKVRKYETPQGQASRILERWWTNIQANTIIFNF
jgi:hypothetical protein